MERRKVSVEATVVLPAANVSLSSTARELALTVLMAASFCGKPQREESRIKGESSAQS